MKPQQVGIVKPHIERAREYLKGKKWAKSWRLAKGIGVSSQVAGLILAFLPEWELWNREAMNRRGRAWHRVKKDVKE